MFFIFGSKIWFSIFLKITAIVCPFQFHHPQFLIQMAPSESIPSRMGSRACTTTPLQSIPWEHKGRQSTPQGRIIRESNTAERVTWQNRQVLRQNSYNFIFQFIFRHSLMFSQSMLDICLTNGTLFLSSKVLLKAFFKAVLV